LKPQPKAPQGQGHHPAEVQNHDSTTLLNLIEITRPLNCVITFLSVLLGGWLGTSTVPSPLLLAALSAAFITGGGNVLNDLCGVAEDKINKPQRPLPSGRLSSKTATIFTIFLLLLGLSLGFTLPTPTPLIAVIAVIGLVFYNIWLKGVPLIGNLLVGALGGLAFLYGGFATQTVHPALWPALFATLFHLGREILKDLEDIAGDQILSGSTLPLSWGKTSARASVICIFSILILLLPLPAILDIYGTPYLILVGILAVLLVYVLVYFLKDDTPASLYRLNILLKAGMMLGLSAFFFDRVLA